jgi:hypothetical protein
LNRLILTIQPPRLGGLEGTLTLRTLSLDQVATLVSGAARAKRIDSQLTYHSTCDMLAALAGLSGIHRYDKERDRKSLDLQPGDEVLICTLKDTARRKAQEALGAVDFTFTLCTFQGP